MRRFGSRLIASGIGSLTEVTADDCDAFLWAPTRRNAPPSLHTVHLRRTALHDLFAVLADLEPSFSDPSSRLDLPPRSGNQARPLTDGEMHLVRTAALGRSHQANRAIAAVSLAEATATTGEIACIRWSSVDLDAGSVNLPGADPVQARRGTLSSWGMASLRRIADDRIPTDDDWVVPRRAEYGDAHSAQAAMSNLLSKVLSAGGLSGPGIRPSSIRLWAGAHVLGTDGVEAAASALGIRSLDATRRALSRDGTS